MIRKFDWMPSLLESDFDRAKRMHKESGLDERCFPNLITTDATGKQVENPLFVAKEVYEVEGQPAMFCFLKMTSELYLLVDHNVGTPEQRWEWLQDFKDHMKSMAWDLGLEQMTAWVPVEIEESFRKRLEDLGFVRSPWQSYTLNLE